MVAAAGVDAPARAAGGNGKPLPPRRCRRLRLIRRTQKRLSESPLPPRSGRRVNTRVREPWNKEVAKFKST